MITARELQTKIIHLVSEITDINQLSEIHNGMQETVSTNKESIATMPWTDAIANIRDHISFDDIIKEQGEKSISFAEFQALADEIEWNCTLDEVLELLD